MKAKQIRFVDVGRGPQLEGSRLTVMDVFYYLHRGYDFNFIHAAMPSLTRDQFDAVVEYAQLHHDELVEKDRRVDEFHKRGIEAQRARGGIFAESEEDLTTDERVARFNKRLELKRSEKNGARNPD